MTEAEWLECEDPTEMLDFLSVIDKGSERKLRLFAYACCRCSRQLLRNKSLRTALEVSTRYADGQATPDELAAAYLLSNGLAVGPYYECNSEREIHRWAEAAAVANATHVTSEIYPMITYATDAVWMIVRAAHRNPNRRLCHLLRDIIGNPLRSVASDPTSTNWIDGCVGSLAATIYNDHAFAHLPILADALEEAGCDNADILTHCRNGGEHVRGCWVVDLLLGKA